MPAYCEAGLALLQAAVDVVIAIGAVVFVYQGSIARLYVNHCYERMDFSFGGVYPALAGY